MNGRLAWLAAGAAFVAATVALSADTLVLRDGRRVQGQLIGVRGDEIEFDGQRGGFFGGRERLRVDRRAVQRSEFDDERDRDRFDRDDRDDRRDDRRDVDRGRPSGLRERTIGVDASVAWVDTGVEVRAGQTVYFSASGRVRWGPNRQDGPEGEHNSPHNDNRPIPGRPAAALIGRIGDTNDWFFIGDDQG